MKKIVVLLLSACMLLGLFSIGTSAASDNQGRSYYAPYGVPTIDGIRDAAWDAATWAYISIGADSNKASVRFKVMHDGNLIYFLAESDDAAVNAALNECIHVSLHTHSCSDPDTCQDFVTEFMRYNGKIWHKQLAQNSSNANFKVKATQSARGKLYTLEWAVIPADPIPKDSSTPFGLEMAMDDYDENGKWVPSQMWNSNTYSASTNAGNFGSLYFLTEAEGGSLAPVTFYDDVPVTHAAYDAIVYMSSRGVFVPASATNPSFYPDQKFSRAQFVTALGRLAGANVSSYTKTSFTDVSFTRDAWFARYAEWAKEVGLVVGPQFMANKTISISEAVVMLQRFADNIDNKYVPTNASLASYSDAASVPSWAKEGMQWAVRNGVYVPTGKALSPSATVNRAMAAQLLYNYESVLTYGNVEGKPGISVSEPPSDIDWSKQFVINALEFGFVNDGKTLNDGIMEYYLEHYSATTPIQFPAGQYAFKYQINFPERIYVELAPRAEWILLSDEVQDFFITLQQGVETYGTFDDYALHAYFRGGTINANYKAKVALGLHGGLHTNFEDFMIRNVLEKGIQTEISTLHNGCYNFSRIYMYNDTGIKGTIAFYDNTADNCYTRCTAVNFETCISTSGGIFRECSGWFNSYGKPLIPTSVYALVRGGNQSVFTTPLVDTYRTGFKLLGTASTSITDMVWITNNNFYTTDIMKQYPMLVFDVASDKAKVMVNGMYLPWREYGFAFSNIPLPSSTFLNVRYEAGWDPWNHMANFRDDTTKLKELISNLYDWSHLPTHSQWHS